MARLKARANEDINTSNKISSFQALSALCWRAIVRTNRLSNDQSTACRLAANNRQRLDPPLPQAYFGNCIAALKTTTTVGELLDHNLGWAASLLHHTVVNHSDKVVRGFVDEWLKSPFIYHLDKLFDCSVMMGSSPRFDMYGNEFGIGKAVALRSGYANKFVGKVTSYEGCLASDVIRITSTDGSNPGPVVKVPNFLFSCAPTSLLKGLSKSVQGIAGLGSTKISPPSQFSSAFSFARKFAICLPSLSEGGNGALFFGDGPYKFFFETDLVSLLTFTPLVTNHVSTGATSFAGEPSSEYFIKVNQLRINNKVVPINKPLLSIDSKGNGGTKLSTTIPYTLMQTSIYKSFINVFVNELRITNVTIVKTIAPFNVCVDPSTFPASRGTDGVPWINFELDGASQAWTLIGGNSFVRVNKDVSCLGIMDGGEKPRTSIVIGGLQLEDNLVQVDMAKSRIGFSSSLRISRTSCSMFNFTSIA